MTDLLELREEFKAESKYNIKSNKGNTFTIIIKNLTSFIEINAICQNNIEINKLTKKYSLLNLKKIKFLSICDSIDEIYNELLFEFSRNISTILEEENQIIIKIPIVHAKYKEICFILNKINKINKENNQNLNNLIFNLQEQIKNKDKENNEKISLCNIEINNLRQIITVLDENNKILTKKIDSLEKDMLELKNDKKILNEKIQSLEDKIKNNNIPQKINGLYDNKFEIIENPWTKELDKDCKKFEYTLKDGDYLAQSNNNFFNIYSLKSKHKFEINKIYKLIYYIKFYNGSFRVGFGDFGLFNKRLKEKGSVGLTNEGLFIDGEKKSDIKLNTNNKEIIFIINLKEKEKYFKLIIDGNSCGKFNFNLDIIYGIAAIGTGSVKIKTYRSVD